MDEAEAEPARRVAQSEGDDQPGEEEQKINHHQVLQIARRPGHRR